MPIALPSTSALLVQGGDHRIEIQPGSQMNKYGCQPFPAADRIAFGSSTASQISQEAFDEADVLRERIAAELGCRPAAGIYKDELERLRAALLEACGLGDVSDANDANGSNGSRGLPPPDLIFAASGTDAHLIASCLIGDGAHKALRAMRVIMVNAEESGSGVSAALSGRNFSSYTALGKAASANGLAHDVVHVSIRHPDGSPRNPASIDADVDFLAESALEAGFQVLLVLIDTSKTGCIAPSPQLAGRLRRHRPGQVHVLVDACQFRIEAATLRAYLQQDFMVAITGSKFIGGPSFSSALLIPQSIAASMRQAGAPQKLNCHSAREEWPDGWGAGKTLPSNVNFGLLLRWQAALCELNALQRVPGSRIRTFLQRFGAAVYQRFQFDSHFERLASPVLASRAAALVPEWDDLQTIHAFTLYRVHPHRRPMDRAEVANLYQRLQQTRHVDGCIYFVGQPVACGRLDGVDISALRLCVSARMIVQACSGEMDRNIEMSIDRAMACLDVIVALIADDIGPLNEDSGRVEFDSTAAPK